MADLRALTEALAQLRGNPEITSAMDCLLAPLKAYDGEHGAGLTRTLRVFIETGGTIALTAERLFLHRNSVVYRLQRVHDLVGLDLRDANTFSTLALASALSDTQGTGV